MSERREEIISHGARWLSMALRICAECSLSSISLMTPLNESTKSLGSHLLAQESFRAPLDGLEEIPLLTAYAEQGGVSYQTLTFHLLLSNL
jgi:hypothetical protein